MSRLAFEIENTHVEPGSIALWWLAQAGFAFKTPAEKVLFLDAYLSDVVERLFGFKRLSATPINADEVRADWVISSHEHLDHLDTDALPSIARNNPCSKFAGPESCSPGYDECGIAPSRRLILEGDRSYELGDVVLQTAKADHGELSPSALAFLLRFDKVLVLFTGDTALRPELMQPFVEAKPDILLPCINGKYGNMNSNEAADLAALVKPRAVIPCHYGMFREHNGDPESFAEACARKCPSVNVVRLLPGEGIFVSRDSICAIPSSAK